MKDVVRSNSGIACRKSKTKVNCTVGKHKSVMNGIYAPSRQTIVQPKLELTTPGDSYEREADHMADFVMRRQNSNTHSEMPSATSIFPPTISRLASNSTGIAVGTNTERSIYASRGGGQPLSGALRAKMENGFGTDFSSVRLHTDNAAVQMSRNLQAKAFTYGNDIYFNSGQYQPHTPHGQHLIAHELTHVLQQSGRVGRKPTWDNLQSNYPLESEGFDGDRVFEYVFAHNKYNWVNTCATRVSIAFIKSGELISGYGFRVNNKSDLYQELGTKKKINIIVGVREMTKWLNEKYGEPTIKIRPKRGNKEVTIEDVREKIANKKGVLLMRKYHVTLWTGMNCIRNDYYPRNRVYFWEFS